MSVLRNFPYDDYRYGQKYLCRKVDELIEDNRTKFIVVEAPTGFGKTAAAGAVAAHHSPAYYLTEQKIHQEQMREEFPQKTSVAKGQRNYNCGEECDECVDPIPGQTCHRKPTPDYTGQPAAESYQRGMLRWRPGIADKCEYFVHKTSAMNAPIACLNYSYFLNETYYTGGAGTHGGDFGDRKVMICDEAHNVASNLQDFLTFWIETESEGGSFALAEEVGLELKDRGKHVRDWEEWICRDLESIVSARLQEVEDQIKREWTQKSDVEYDLLDKRDKLDEILCNIHRFGTEYDAEYFGEMDWAVDRRYDEDDNIEAVRFAPVSVAPFAERFLFDYADVVILMSATILDTDILLRTLGLSQYADRTFTIPLPSPFDPEIRPITYYDAPIINHENKWQKLPKVAELIDAVAQLPEHVDQKGIIHSVSYENEDIIRRNVSRSVRGRLMSHEDRNREDVLEEFKHSDQPKILMSPGIYEGVDLKYDMSRFQIVPKVPYLSLGSTAVKKMKEKDGRWYDWRTAVRLIQSFGRSVRADDDYAATYILDGSFVRFLHQNSGLFPDYIISDDNEEDALQEGDIRELFDQTHASV